LLLLLLLLLLAASFYRSCMAHLQELLARDMAKGQPRFKTLQHACWLLLLLLQLLAGSSCWRARLLLLHRGYGVWKAVVAAAASGCQLQHRLRCIFRPVTVALHHPP
jgi:hypothetical protein